MKVLIAVLSLSFLLVGCEQKKVVEDVEYEDSGMVGVPPKRKVKEVTPAPKPGEWKWDKNARSNPLEQRPR